MGGKTWALTIFRIALVIAMFTSGYSISAAEHVEITFMSWYTGTGRAPDDPFVQLELAAIARFNELNPDIRVVPAGGDPRQELVIRVAGGVPPDVSVIGQNQLASITQLALDITEYVERSGLDLNIYHETVLPVIEREGRIYGLPWEFSMGHPLFYNRTLFDQAGLASPSPDVIWSVEEFRDAARKLTRDENQDGTPDVYGFGDAFSHTYHPYFLVHGGQPATVEDGRLRATFTDPDYVDGVQLLVDMVHNDRSAIYGGRHRGGFAAGTVAMTNDAPAGILHYLDINLHEFYAWGTTYWPAGRGPSANYTNTVPMAVIQGTKHPEEAYRFLEWYAGPEGDEFRAKYMGFPVTLQGMATIGSELDLPLNYTLEQLVTPLRIPPERLYLTPVHMPGFADGNNALRNKIVELLRDGGDVSVAFQEIAESIQAIFDAAAAP